MIDFGFASAIFGKPLMGRSAIAVICLGSLILGVSESGLAEDQPALDGQPPICSPATARTFLPKGVCEAKPLGNGRHEVKINLVPQSAKISVGGYEVTTENYNGSYLTPIVQANPGDVVAARVTNVLPHRTHPHSTHDGDENPTNLHYFHGGIVTPNNARPKAAEEGNGDNIYAHIAARHPRQPSGRQGVHGDRATNNVKEFWVPIPGKGELDGRVFELREGMYIEHPSGLNWYHSHLHGISSDQVMGGMSGMLTVGKDTANVGAACLHSEGSTKCTNDVAGDTAMLKRVTDVRYVLLRDLRLKDLKQRPDEVNGGAPATWNPDPVKFPANALCGAWDPTKSKLVEDIRLRQGFCQPDLTSAWLFTLNGQRYPTVTVNAGKNLLLRLANVSANVGYWLELIKQEDLGKPDPMRKNLSILSVDGVVPTSPVASDGAFTPILAAGAPSVLVMPAARIELYVRNDEAAHSDDQVWILKSKRLEFGPDDVWPEVLLARIVLKKSPQTSAIPLGLSPPRATARLIKAEVERAPLAVSPPPGCIRDLVRESHEYRRVTFWPASDDEKTQFNADWSVQTDIIRPDPANPQPESGWKPFDPDHLSIEHPFEFYALPNGLVDWEKPSHVCIELNHTGSHQQLWVLYNATGTLHNFHIHQMKFRLATKADLLSHGIQPSGRSHTCNDGTTCSEPDYELYDSRDQPPGPNEPLAWHDTIPVPGSGDAIFLVMSFDAPQQVGRFVYHCHILKHEDAGLMAPIEVWSSAESEPTR